MPKPKSILAYANQSATKSQVNMSFCKIFSFFLIIAQIAAFEAGAEDLQERFQDWTFFKTNSGGETLCYLLSLPIKSGQTKEKRGEAFLMITNVKNDADEISASSGALYNEKSDVEMSFGKRKYYLLTFKSRAWAYDKNDDIDIIKQMQSEADVVVSAILDADENVNDTYSLIGFVNAYSKMKQSCKN